MDALKGAANIPSNSLNSTTPMLLFGLSIPKPFPNVGPNGKFAEYVLPLGIPIPGGGAQKGATAAAEGLADSANLATRASEIHSALDPIAQEMRTTAVATVTNPDGTVSTLAASSRNTLAPAQRAVLQEGETAVSGAGHAEETILNSTQQNGQTVNSMGVSRTPCPSCQQKLGQAGVDVSVKKTPE